MAVHHFYDNPNDLMDMVMRSRGLPPEGPDERIVPMLDALSSTLAQVCAFVEQYPAETHAFDWVSAILAGYSEMTNKVLVVDDDPSL